MKTALFMVAFVLVVTSLACSFSGSQAEPTRPLAPIQVSGDLSKIDVCRAIPKEDIEAVMGRKLASAPEPFDFFETPGASGCTYEAGKDLSGNAYFGYVVLTPVSVYQDQPLYKNVDVSGIGQSAYFNNGADARQLWVKMNDKVAFVVAFGDSPNEEGAKKIARLVAAAIK